MSSKDLGPDNQKQAPGEENHPNSEDMTELTEEDLEQVNGGEITQDITVNKAKTRDKNFTAIEDWIKS